MREPVASCSTLHGYMDVISFIEIGDATLLFPWIEARAAKTAEAWILKMASEY